MGADEQSDYAPSWYAGTAAGAFERPQLTFDLDVDVCVIGGGLAGLTAAREVARRGWSVAVVEARRVAWNASGRNSGFVSPGYSAQIEKIVERIGLPAAKALWELSEAGVQYVHDTIEEIGGRGIVDILDTGLRQLPQRLADTLVPITVFTGVTQSLGGRLAEAVTFGGAVSDSRHANYHYRIVGGDRLLWTASASVGSRSKWIQRSLERALRATYPQLGAVQFERFWPAEMGFAVHGMPQIGEVQPGVWLASAFGGQGLNTSAMAGNLIARAIVEGDDTWRRFLPFELVWAGGRVGRTVVRAAAWWRHQSEAVAALAVRQRAELRRKREARKGKLAKTAPDPDYGAVAALKRAMKGSFAAAEHDRPIGAPEAMPSAGLDTGSGPPPSERTGSP